MYPVSCDTDVIIIIIIFKMLILHQGASTYNGRQQVMINNEKSRFKRHGKYHCLPYRHTSNSIVYE